MILDAPMSPEIATRASFPAHNLYTPLLDRVYTVWDKETCTDLVLQDLHPHVGHTQVHTKCDELAIGYRAVVTGNLKWELWNKFYTILIS